MIQVDAERPAGQQAVLEAARHEFAERGYGAASIRGIARRAQVSLSAMYHYYAGKQELLHALLDESSAQYFASCEAELARAGADAGERLAALVRATVRYRAEHRLESSLLLTECRHLSEGRLKEARQRQYDGSRLFHEVVDGGVAQGVFRTPHPEDARRGVIAMCNAVAQWYRAGGDVGVGELAERYVELALVLVEYRPAGSLPRRSG
ncbi:TetR/AcrR family transcriptional regulator [Streptomyces purpurogeneiscleroticus]|uniref:TetR/AcrR family transcriptional regulator n=1 Tax=Streptomyces purpurogeneiscleroticus TaxID=68259 RepID=UPI001CBE3A20|nr:TetR/AcrR family transcriptional regulator [Streptomyces purpurogeneiscleroticus]MBZ4017876.1 hypothetical protein [Streptomyces purpurogeneiscleroticus]